MLILVLYFVASEGVHLPGSYSCFQELRKNSEGGPILSRSAKNTGLDIGCERSSDRFVLTKTSAKSAIASIAPSDAIPKPLEIQFPLTVLA